MNTTPFIHKRTSRMTLQEGYFWTDTIKDWKHLLKQDKYKEIIIEELKWLKNRSKIAVYGFVIMPNHIHLLWEIVKKNGKENPQVSFLKYISNMIQDDLRINHPEVLKFFYVNESDRDYRFWLHDPLAVKMQSREMVEQKLDYIHLNPLQSHWNLTKDPEEYYSSSARFYLDENCEFEFINHYKDRL